MHYGELRVVGASDSRPEHVIEAVQLMAGGKIDTSPIVTHRVGLESFHQGIALMRDKKSLKVMDTTAASLCMENSIPIVVFNIFSPGSISRIIEGKAEGTLVTD